MRFYDSLLFGFSHHKIALNYTSNQLPRI